MTNRNRALQKFTNEQLADLRSQGLSVPEMAQIFAVSTVAVYARIRKVDGTQKPRSQPEYYSWNGIITRLRQRPGEGDEEFGSRVLERRERMRESGLNWSRKPEAKVLQAKNQNRRYADPAKWRHFLDYQAAYRSARYKEEPSYRIGITLRGRLQKAFSGYLINHRWNTQRLTGCDIERLVDHLESQFTEGMSLCNYGKWEIDHVIPVSYFDLRCPLQQVLAFHYSNLQPLWRSDNRKKKHPPAELGIPKRKRRKNGETPQTTPSPGIEANEAA